MDEVEDVSTKLERNPRTRTTSADVAEKSGAVVCEGNAFPLKSGEGSFSGGHIRILLLKTGEELIAEAKADRGYGIPGEGIGDRILLARNMLKGTVELRNCRQMVLLAGRAGFGLLGEGVDER